MIFRAWEEDVDLNGDGDVYDKVLKIYDPATGGCRDGLHSDRPNDNQGAESTLSFLLALVEMRLATRSVRSDPTNITKLKKNIS